MGRIMSFARKHGLKVLEDVAQSCGGQYREKRLGAIGDIGIYSFQIHKLITAGEGGAVVTNDPLLYERAIRFHDLGLIRRVHQKALGMPPAPVLLPAFAGINYRMNEMTGAVMRGQVRKLETTLAQLRRSGRFVSRRLEEVRGLKLRVSHDPKGEIGWTIGFLLPDKQIRNRFVAAVEAENVPIRSPSSAEVLPPLPYVANKVAPHPAWPSFNSPRGKEIRYGAECCPRTLDIFGRAAKLTISQSWTEGDLNDIVAAITKVHRAVVV
jgi:8-amino-3,8-dideoxy-alpha-D-manno-octulosonate transaminase